MAAAELSLPTTEEGTALCHSVRPEMDVSGTSGLLDSVTSCTCLAELEGKSWTSHLSLSYHHHPPSSLFLTMSLLQDVLRTQTLDSLDKTLSSGRNTPDDDDELVNVVSILLVQLPVCHLIVSPTDVLTRQSWKVPSNFSACISPSFSHSRISAKSISAIERP